MKTDKINFSKENSDLIHKNYIKNGFIFLKNILTTDEIDIFKKILKKKIEEILGTNFEKLLIGETQKISSKMIEKLRADLNYRSKIFEKVPKRIFTILSKVLNKEIIFFPVNKVRINIPQINTRIFEWHQDEATWPELRNIGCHTIWVSLTHADNKNGIQIYNKKLNKLAEHINDDYLNKKKMILDENKIIKTKGFIPGDGIMFNEFILHKTLSNKNGLPRISLDLRFTGREKNLKFDFYHN